MPFTSKVILWADLYADAPASPGPRQTPTSVQVSYNILSKVSAVTHSVANCVKRVVVIVAAVIFFRHPVSPLNAIGTALALGGVFLYSQTKLRERGAVAKSKALQQEARAAWAAAAARANMS